MRRWVIAQVIGGLLVWSASIVAVLGLVPVIYAIHSAVTGYWGPEWPNVTRDAVDWSVVWLMWTGCTACGWLIIVRRSNNRPSARDFESVEPWSLWDRLRRHR
jgi:hypothetical protein